MILFGGYNGSYLNTTWTWNGSTWTELFPATSPSPRSSSIMAYDPATSQLVLLGGFNGSSFLNDTWTWNGSTWTELSTSGPSDFAGDRMAYDTATSQLVLFGGDIADQTWTWNGSTWTELFPATSPPSLVFPSMGYDAGTGQLVLFGGFNLSDVYVNTTWTWDGSTWTEQFPSTSPSPRSSSIMAYDPATSQLVVLGGFNGSFLDDTWTWDGSTWTEQPATSPFALDNDQMAYDTAASQLVFFGGGTGNETWIWDLGQTISFTTPTSGPVGGSATLSATGGTSGNPVVFSVDAATPTGVCNVSGINGTTVNYTAAGICIIDANQAGNSTYAAAPQVQQWIMVVKLATNLRASVTVSPWKVVDGLIVFSATLTTSGQGVAGQLVTFYLNGLNAGSFVATTNSNGVAAGDIVVRPGFLIYLIHSFSVAYGGSNTYEPSSTTGTIRS